MNNILIPEKNKILLKSYHISSLALIPLVFASCTIDKLQLKELNNFVYTANVANVTFHSYVSASCIITDYIKPNLSKGLRALSLGLHSVAFYGYLKNQYKKL